MLRAIKTLLQQFYKNLEQLIIEDLNAILTRFVIMNEHWYDNDHQNRINNFKEYLNLKLGLP
jgi:hypothetical protein